MPYNFINIFVSMLLLPTEKKTTLKKVHFIQKHSSSHPSNVCADMRADKSRSFFTEGTKYIYRMSWVEPNQLE